jgi:hypothetical protein
VVLQPEQEAEGHLQRRWDVLSRLGRPGGFEGRGGSLSPQAHGRADHLAGLEAGRGPRGLRGRGEGGVSVLPRNWRGGEIPRGR